MSLPSSSTSSSPRHNKSIIPIFQIIVVGLVLLAATASILIMKPSMISAQTTATTTATTAGKKYAIINFDDGYQNQFLNAKPILDQYGYKASFFIPCAKMGNGDPMWMSWSQLTKLQDDGMDIESHTMTHAHLNKFLNGTVADNLRLRIEIAGSKACLEKQGFSPTIFGYPLNLGADIPEIVDRVAKSYSFARSGSDQLFFLDCQHYDKHPSQPDCRTYNDNNELTYANRYDIRAQSFDHIDKATGAAIGEQEQFQKFVKRVNSQAKFNVDGDVVEAIPIMTFHSVTDDMDQYNAQSSTITVDLFSAMMKYLHDNDFTVLQMTQLAYDDATNKFYVAPLQ